MIPHIYITSAQKIKNPYTVRKKAPSQIRESADFEGYSSFINIDRKRFENQKLGIVVNTFERRKPLAIPTT